MTDNVGTPRKDKRQNYSGQKEMKSNQLSCHTSTWQRILITKRKQTWENLVIILGGENYWILELNFIPINICTDGVSIQHKYSILTLNIHYN